MKLLVSMGMRDHEGAPLRGRLVELDLDGGVTRELRVALAPEHVPGPDSHQELTCACVDADGLVVQPAHTELLWIDPKSLEIVRRASHPLFHGLHSAAVHPATGEIAVTCAGTESVLVLDEAGALRRHHWLRDPEGGTRGFGAAYRGIRDFRLVDHDALKPHSHHPNHATWVGDDLWVTCFETQDCRSLTSPRRIGLGGAIPHDGRLREGHLWFTQVTGRVVVVEPVTGARVAELDLAAAAGTRRRLGWCRGVELVGGRLFVGFTMLRSTRHREVLRQLLLGELGEKLPTRIVEVDRSTGALLGEWILGNTHGGTLYGILAHPA